MSSINLLSNIANLKAARVLFLTLVFSVFLLSADALSEGVDEVIITPEGSTTAPAGVDLQFTAEALDEDKEVITSTPTDFSWTNADENGVFNEEIQGEWLVSASYDGKVSSPTLVTVKATTPVSFFAKPEISTIVADSTQTYTVWGVDKYGNQFDTEEAKDWNWSIEEGAGGSWEDNIYTSKNAGFDWKVTGKYDDITITARLSVIPDEVTISPSEAQTVTAGDELQFSAEAKDKQAQVLASTATDFSWDNADEEGVFNEALVGEYHVTASYIGVTSTPTSVTVEAAEPASIVFDREEYYIAAGKTSTITLAVKDLYGNAVPDKTVSLQVTEEAGELNEAAVSTDEMGEAEFTFTQDLQEVRLNTVEAEWDGAPQVSGVLKINVGLEVSAEDGGQITAAEEPATKAIIPAGAISSDIEVFIKLQDAFTGRETKKINRAADKVPEGRFVPGSARGFFSLNPDGSEYGEFDELVTIEIPYDEINDLPADEIKMLRLNPTREEWEVVSEGGINEVDESAQVVRAEVGKFSIFALGSTLETKLDNVVAYPNPVDFSEAVRGTLKFQGLSKDSTINIFDVTGRLVREIEPEDGTSGKAEWDGKNESGSEVSMGTYIYHISDEDGNNTTGRVGVIK